MRVCSLLPSATEMIGQLGLTDHLVAVSEECDWPPEVRRLPRATRASIDSRRVSREIDAAVRSALAAGRQLYGVDERLLDELRPDLVVTQDLCTVCAVSSETLGPLDADVLALDARTLDGIADSAVELARRLGVPERGHALAAAMHAEVDEVRRLVSRLPRPRVAVLEWLDPPFAAAHWVPEMVEAAGGDEVLGRAGEPSFTTSWEAVAAAAPDLLVLAPCGFDAERAAREAEHLELPARAVAVDANAYFSRPSPRVVDGIRQLAHLLHPEVAGDPGLPALDVGYRSVVT